MKKPSEVATGMVSLFDSITPKEMAEFEHKDNQIAPILSYVKQDQKSWFTTLVISLYCIDNRVSNGFWVECA